MPIAASEKAALPKTDIRAVHQALDAEHRTWAREDDSPQGSVKARLEQDWPDSLADGQLIKDDEGRDQLKEMPDAKRSSMFPDPWRTNPVIGISFAHQRKMLRFRFSVFNHQDTIILIINLQINRFSIFL